MSGAELTKNIEEITKSRNDLIASADELQKKVNTLGIQNGAL